MSAIDNVSRETTNNLKEFCADATKWNAAINLVSKSTVSQIWDRHIVDSLQLLDCVDRADHWIDIGSGGGFPGIVCAIAAAERFPRTRFTLIESDARKSVFLTRAIQKFRLQATVKTQRIENYTGATGDIVSARALKALPELIGLSGRLIGADGLCLFPKGKNHAQEVSDARKEWSFDCDVLKSETSPDAAILRIRNVSRNG